MADVWRPRVSRGQRRDRSLGTIDGRLLQASRVARIDETRRPDDTLRPIQFNSGGSVTDGTVSPPYLVPADSIIIGLTLVLRDGGVRADILVNGSKKTSITYSGSSYKEKENLDIGVDSGDKITVRYNVTSGSPTEAVVTVNLLED